MNTIKGFIAAAVVVLQFFPQCVQAENPPPDRESLRGIKRIGVTIGKLSHQAKKMGIKGDALREGCADLLKKAGMDVATPEELHAGSALPYLQVILYLSDSTPTVSYTLMLGLYEKVRLERDPTICAYAMPWWRVLRGDYAGTAGLEKEIEDNLRRLLKEFVDDYFSVNPRQNAR